jgi:hypothetical protein
MKVLLLSFFLFRFSFLIAQGDANLLLQYRRGPSPDAFYHKWNLAGSVQGYWMNADKGITKAGISFGGGIMVEHHFSKTFGLASGWQWFPLHYSYQLEDDTSKDKVSYWEIPLVGQLSPSRKLTFIFGPTYNLLRKAENFPQKEESTPYEKGVFHNAFGALLGIQYVIWENWAAAAQFRFIKKSTSPLQLQSNNFSGPSLSLRYFLKNPTRPPKDR